MLSRAACDWAPALSTLATCPPVFFFAFYHTGRLPNIISSGRNSEKKKFFFFFFFQPVPAGRRPDRLADAPAGKLLTRQHAGRRRALLEGIAGSFHEVARAVWVNRTRDDGMDGRVG